MSKDIYTMTIVAHASSFNAMLGVAVETITEFKDSYDAGKVPTSAFCQGGGHEGMCSLNYTAPEDLVFSIPSEPDSPDLSEVPEDELEVTESELAEMIPAEIKDLLTQLQSMGAKISFTKVPKE